MNAHPDEIAAIMGTAWSAPGRKEYKLVVADGRVVELVGSDAQAPADEAYVSMKEAARLLHRSYFWLVRNWKKIGLHRSDFGRPYVFERKEIDAFLVRNRFRYRGRPTKGSKGAL